MKNCDFDIMSSANDIMERCNERESVKLIIALASGVVLTRAYDIVMWFIK